MAPDITKPTLPPSAASETFREAYGFPTAQPGRKAESTHEDAGQAAKAHRGWEPCLDPHDP